MPKEVSRKKVTKDGTDPSKKSGAVKVNNFKYSSNIGELSKFDSLQKVSGSDNVLSTYEATSMPVQPQVVPFKASAPCT